MRWFMVLGVLWGAEQAQSFEDISVLPANAYFSYPVSGEGDSCSQLPYYQELSLVFPSNKEVVDDLVTKEMAQLLLKKITLETSEEGKQSCYSLLGNRVFHSADMAYDTLRFKCLTSPQDITPESSIGLLVDGGMDPYLGYQLQFFALYASKESRKIKSLFWLETMDHCSEKDDVNRIVELASYRWKTQQMLLDVLKKTIPASSSFTLSMFDEDEDVILIPHTIENSHEEVPFGILLHLPPDKPKKPITVDLSNLHDLKYPIKITPSVNN